MTVMFLIILGLFLTFAAFALDLGNIYMWQLRVDKAARAGALAGLGYRGLNGWSVVADGSAGQTSMLAAASDAAKDNFAAYGIDRTSPDLGITNNYDRAADTLTTTVTLRVNTILVERLNNIVGFGFNTGPSPSAQATDGKLTITRTHTARLSTANVVLILDVSGSMLCPSAGNCNCQFTPTGCPIGSSKLYNMLAGVQIFASHFNPNRDRIALIPFNLAAQTLYSMTNAGAAVHFKDGVSRNPVFNGTDIDPNPAIITTGSNLKAFDLLTSLANLKARIPSITGSNTNQCDGLAEAIRELETLSSVLFGNNGTPGTTGDRRQLQPFVVLFSDGAPSAFRGIFSASELPPARCDTYNAGARNPAGACSSQDMYHYALRWVDGLNPNNQYNGPGPFVQRDVDPTTLIPRLFNFSIAPNAVAPNGSLTCGIETSDPTKFEDTIRNFGGGGESKRGNDATGCLQLGIAKETFSFGIPYTNPDASGGFTGTYGASVSNVHISSINTTWRDPHWPASFFTATPVPGYGVQKYDQLPYYCAVEAADYLRTRFGATIFTIGLGPGGISGTATCQDPLQDADDQNSRKDLFLTRLAFSRQMFNSDANGQPTVMDGNYKFANTHGSYDISASGCSTHRFHTASGTPAAPPIAIGFTKQSNQLDGNTTYKDLRPFRPAVMDGYSAQRRINTQGEYFPTNDPTEVPTIFGLIAKSILLRSTS